jgi:hypothetical protein
MQKTLTDEGKGIMRKNHAIFRGTGPALAVAFAMAAFLSMAAAASQSPAKLLHELKGPFDLAAGRAPEIHYFRMETQVVHLGFDGKRTGTETYVLDLECVPSPLAGGKGDRYTCRRFELRMNGGEPVTIPALREWTYTFTSTPSGMDSEGQVFGIPHAKFEGITDSRGVTLAPAIRYAVYNTFIDFHAFNDGFARPTEGGKGIQDLTMIGQKIVHAAAFSEPPVNLGSGIKKGSVFRNGEVTLEFKGLGVVDGAVCAVVGYDSGESTLKMIMPFGPDKEIVTEGGSEYKGDLFVGLATRWVRKVTMDEFVVTSTKMPGPGPKIDAYTVRHLLMRMTGKEEFARDQPAGK